MYLTQFSMLLEFFLLLQIVIKPSSLSRVKTIFTQEIFTEQVLAFVSYWLNSLEE